MRTITCEDLKRKLDRGDDFKLVMVLGDWAYCLMHIPGSLHYGNILDCFQELSPEDEIVVYCSGPYCSASVYAYRLLESRGFRKVWRFAGGLEDWQAAGFPLEGRLVGECPELF